jgi:ketosteroid isomerase-like protein
MSRNVDTGNAIYEYFSKGDVPGILDRLVPDVEWEHDWGAPPLKWYVPRRGRAEVVKFFQTLADFELLRFERVAFLEGANVVEVPIPIELRGWSPQAAGSRASKRTLGRSATTAW